MNIWNPIWKLRRKRTELAVMIATALGMSCILAGCGEKQVTVPDVTFENEGHTYAESVEKEGASQSGEFDKEENVQVEADATGKVRTITVETRLRSENSAAAKAGAPDDSESRVGADTRIEDYSLLHDIRNTEGDEEFRMAGDGRLFWEDTGEDIHYEGTATSELPVTLRISYELDGKTIPPEELAGKSGKLKMRFDYENRTKEMVAVGEKNIEVCVPFTVLTMVVLPEKIFSDVEIKNGKLLSMEDDRIAVGYAFPGLGQSLMLSDIENFEDVEIPDYVEILARVTDFELDFTATVITPGLLEDLDTEDLEDIEELIHDMDELRDASKELVDGTGELADGVDEFGDYLQEYVDAMDELRNGTLKLWEGTRELGKYAGQLENGAKALQDGLEALQRSLAGNGLSGTVSGGDSAAATDLTASTAELKALLGDMNTRLARLESSVDSSDTDAQSEIAALKQEITVLGQALEGLSGTMTDTMAGAAKAQEQLSTAVGQLAAGSAKLTEGLAAFGEGITAFGEGASALDDGVSEIRDAGRELRDGYDELIEGVGEFRDGVKEFDEEGIQKLTDLAGEDLQNLVDHIRALKEADGRYINFGGILPGKTGSVRFIIETDEIKK